MSSHPLAVQTPSISHLSSISNIHPVGPSHVQADTQESFSSACSGNDFPKPISPPSMNNQLFNFSCKDHQGVFTCPMQQMQPDNHNVFWLSWQIEMVPGQTIKELHGPSKVNPERFPAPGKSRLSAAASHLFNGLDHSSTSRGSGMEADKCGNPPKLC